MDLELDDLGSGIGRGLVAMASCDDDSGDLVVRVFAEAGLPIAGVEQFLGEARERLLPSG